MNSVQRFVIRSLIRINDFLLDQVNIYSVKFNSGVHPKHELMKYYNFFLKNIRPASRVLDIGCGYGYVAYKISKKAGWVTGIDFDTNTLTRAKSNYSRIKNLEFIYGDVTTYVFSKKYHYVVLSNVLEHIEKRIEFLKKVKFLAPTLLIRVPAFDRDWMPAYKRSLGLFPYSDSTHFTEYTESSFRVEMKAAGLQIKNLSIQYGEIWAVVNR